MERRELLTRATSPSTIATRKNDLHKLLQKNTAKAYLFTSHFPQFIYTMENTTQDMDLLLLAIEKLQSKKGPDVDTPGLGMVVMRALYYLQNDAMAQQVNC